MSTDSRWFEPDGRPRYGPLTQLEWYEQVRLELEGHAVCEANMDAEVKRLQTELAAAERDGEDQAADRAALVDENERLRATKNYNESLAKQEIERLRAERDEVRAVSDRQAAEIERLRALNADAVAAATMNAASAREARDEVERLRADTRAAERRISDHCDERDRLRADVERLSGRLPQGEEQRLRAAVSGLHGEVDNSDAEVARLRESRRQAEGKLVLALEEVERLRADLATAQRAMGLRADDEDEAGQGLSPWAKAAGRSYPPQQWRADYEDEDADIRREAGQFVLGYDNPYDNDGA